MSNNSNTTNVNSGISLASVLTVTFVLLKVFGKVDWSWWIVFSPLWISAILVLVLFIVAFAIYWWVTD